MMLSSVFLRFAEGGRREGCMGERECVMYVRQEEQVPEGPLFLCTIRAFFPTYQPSPSLVP